MSRKAKKRKRRSRARPVPRSPSALATDEYRRGIREADQILRENGAEIRPENWQELALDWFAPDEPERGKLARYVAGHEHQLGIPWARDLLRLSE